MEENLRNNRLALESLFDDEFYHVAPAALEQSGDNSDTGDNIPMKDALHSAVSTHTEKKKMDKPCMVFLPENDPTNQRNLVDLWRKILASVQLSPNMINILELQPGILTDNILEGNHGSPIIFWTGEGGIPDLDGFAAYEIHENEDVAFVISDPLPAIAKDRDKKVLLWSVLQKMNFTPGE